MNIYLESVDLEEIRNAVSAGLADGVAFAHTASVTDVADANTRERLEEISREFAFPICVPVGAVSSSDIYRPRRRPDPARRRFSGTDGSAHRRGRRSLRDIRI